MSGEFFFTVTPSRRTSSGSFGSAIATRFWTSTCAMSRSVPSAKVTVSCSLPSAVAWLTHVEHVLDAVDLLLERRRDGIADDLGRGAGIAGADDDRRRRDLRILRDRQGEIGGAADELIKIERTVAKIGRSTKKCEKLHRRLAAQRALRLDLAVLAA